MRRNNIIILMFIFFMGVSSTCFAGDRYQYISENKDSKYYFDTSTIKHIPSDKSIDFMATPYKVAIDNGTIDFWIKFEYTDIGKSTSRIDNLSYALEHWMIKTSPYEIKYMAYIEYDDDGRVLSQNNIPSYQQKFEAVVPGSVGENCSEAVTNYMINFYTDLKTLPERMEKLKEYTKQVNYLNSQALLSQEFKWISSSDKKSNYYNPISLKLISTSPKIIDVVFRFTYNQEGLDDFINRRQNIGIVVNEKFDFVLSHMQINITDHKVKTIGFADYDKNGKVLFKVIIPGDKRIWTNLSDSPSDYFIGELIKQF